MIRRERGSASILLAGLMGVVVLLGCTAMVIAGYLLANHRARTAADLAALSAAAAFAAEGDACGQARATASADGADLLQCEVAGDEIDFVVSLRVSVPTRTRLPGLPRDVAAIAHAGPIGLGATPVHAGR